MSNATENVSIEFKTFWLIGITLSSICVILQLVLYILLPKIRKLDQKILTQLSIARLVYTISEYIFLNVYFEIVELTLTLYVQNDAAMVCWMFIFTKNLYDKVIVVMKPSTWNLLLISILVWTLTLPVGLLCPICLHLGVYDKFYTIFGIIKFIVLSINVIFFCRIFYVVVQRNQNSKNSNLGVIIKSIVIAFLLVCTCSVQVFLNDLSSILFEENAVVTYTFCVLNSFHVVAVSMIFMILVKSAFIEWYRRRVSSVVTMDEIMPGS